jgi:single-strand DNA-binding protein
MVIGRLGKDPVVSYTSGGKARCKFSIATTEKWKDKDGDWKSKTEWHNIIAWGKLAEICGEHLDKGNQVYIEGSLTTNDWERDGHRFYKTEIKADKMVMLGEKKDKPAKEDITDDEPDCPF